MTYTTYVIRNGYYRMPVLSPDALSHATASMQCIVENRPVTLFQDEGAKTYHNRADFAEDFAAWL